MVGVWKDAVTQAAERLFELGCAFAAVDVLAALSACFVPLLSPLLDLARIALLLILVPAVLRVLAMQHADREDADLMKAIAIAVGVATVYALVRTAVVVEVCSL